MADVVSAAERSRMMSGIRGANTKPELAVRRGLHARGFRFKLHDQALPGKPDIVLPRYRSVIFVNGCFWHGHECHLFKWPKSRERFWREKIEANRKRDEQTTDQLTLMGYNVRTVWECELRAAKSNLGPVIDEIEQWLRKR